MISRKTLDYITIFFSLVGLAAMLYLLLSFTLNFIPQNSCDIISSEINCSKVVTSNYSTLFGIDWYYYGIGFFSIVIILSILRLFDKNEKQNKIFAQTINKNIRQNSDVFFRYGGEEFVLVSSNHIRNSLQEARFLTKKLKDAVEKIRIPNLPKITCSMGVGFFDNGKTKEEILKEADNNVYLAKENGRNRIYITKDIAVV